MMADTTSHQSKRKKHTKGGGFEITADDSLTSDPVSELKLKIEEAKSIKDFKLAQKLREQLWTLRDTGVLGPGVSDVQRSTVEVDEPSSNSSLEHQPESSLSDENPAAKSLQKLEKKMKSIEELKERKSKGIKLEANQRAKIGTEDELRKEIELLKEILSKST